MGVFILLLLGVNAFSVWFANGIDKGSDGETTIQNDVVNGAGYFLDSYANTLLFMKKTELSVYQGMNYDELSNLLNKAVESMRAANETYARLKQAADNTPYNAEVIDYLKNYDYNNLQEAAGLDEVVFAEVKMYLGNGDIRGVYAKILADTEKILSLFTPVKAAVDAGKFPTLADVWNLNQAFSRTLMFGQYAARVFHEIKE